MHRELKQNFENGENCSG